MEVWSPVDSGFGFGLLEAGGGSVEARAFPGAATAAEELMPGLRPAITAWQSVYVIESADGHYKVGISRDPVARCRELQRSTPLPLEFVGATLVAPSGVSARAMERRAHEILSHYRVSGEWFSAPLDFVHGALRVAYAELRRPDVVDRWRRIYGREYAS